MRPTRSFGVALNRCHYVNIVACLVMLGMMPLASIQAGESTPAPSAPEQQSPELVPDPAPAPAAPGNESDASDGSVPAGQEEAALPAQEAPVVEETTEPLPAPANPIPAASTPEIQPTATSPPTVEPSPTVAPTPVPLTISWSQPEPVRCTILAGNAQSLALGDSATWRCDATIATTSTGDLPDDLKLTWMLRADYGGDSVSFRLLEGSTDEMLPSIDIPEGIEAQMQVRTPWVDADVQTLTYDVTVTRTTCTVGNADLRLTAAPSFETSAGDIQISRADSPMNPPIIATTTASANGSPTLRFDGPIVFESLSATSDGLESTISSGTAVIVVDGAWNPCDTWVMQLNGIAAIDSSLPAQLRVVSINHVALPGGACDLGAACDVIVLPATGSAATPLRYTVGLELELSQFTPVGVVGITVNADLASVETQP